MLEEMKKSISAAITGFPEPISKIEADYQELIRLLEESRADVISKKDRALTDMTDYYTMWAHQIKTPIAAMRLMLQSEQKEQNAGITEQLFKIEQYVEMVLGYLRTESMSGDLVIKSCSLDGIVKQAIKKYAKSFIYKKIMLDYSDLEINVVTDEKWLCFVIEQILSNALKYTNKGKISIYRDASLPPALVIEDTGIGIQPEDLPRIGEKGFTGYNGHEDKKSTGIGLYLCKKILKSLSHTMIIESEVGVGTRVKIVMAADLIKHE
jgi:signal transduction histidine kinase